MKRFAVVIAVAISLFLLILCSEKQDDPFIVSMIERGVDAKLVSGIPEIDEQHYGIEEVLSIGGEEPVPALFMPNEVLVDNNEYLYFRDEDRIKKFSPNGKFIKMIGNKGQGPGEIDYPKFEGIVNDLLVVGQYMYTGGGGFRSEAFNLNGDHVRRIHHPLIKEGFFPKARNNYVNYIDDNKFLFYSNLVEANSDGKEYTDTKYGFVDSEGKVIKELMFEIDPILTGYRFDGGWTSRPLTMSGCSVYPAEDKIYLLSPTGKDIYIYDTEGEILQVFRLDMIAPDVEQEEKDITMERFRQFSTPERLSAVTIPDKKPAVYKIYVDDKDQIWLTKGDTFDYNLLKKDYTYIILSESGKYIGTQTSPMKISCVKNNHSYGILTTEEGFRIFKKYKLIEN
jgi:hypothetical protein